VARSEVVQAMARGSVIVDLAAERGGNCELTRPDETVDSGGVKILGPTNLPASVPYEASSMFSHNLTALLKHLVKDKKLRLEGEDPILRETLAVRDGVILHPRLRELYGILMIVSLALGVLMAIGIGSADMPVVIALLNSYSGLAGSAAGFALDNQVLIIAGALVGASGLILTGIMCRAMNRSMLNVLFGGWGAEPVSEAASGDFCAGKVKATSAEEVAMLLDAARRVVIVPGYGLAVARAQSAVRDVLLAEADVSSDRRERRGEPVGSRRPQEPAGGHAHPQRRPSQDSGGRQTRSGPRVFRGAEPALHRQQHVDAVRGRQESPSGLDSRREGALGVRPAGSGSAPPRLAS
jgi:hypothetical protein